MGALTAATAGNDSDSETVDDDGAAVTGPYTVSGSCSGGGGGLGGGKEGSGGDNREKGLIERVPALLALLRVVRGVPPETLSQQRDTAVSAVVQALRSGYPPLQAEALETFQVKGEGQARRSKNELRSCLPPELYRENG